MAQHDYNIANQTFPSFRSDLNNALSAIQTTNSGTSLPTGAVAGQIWLDTTNATNPTLKFYDGTDSISLATINYTANTVDWLDSSVSITGLSTSATGTVLTLSDTVTTSTVNLIIDNQKEVRFRETTANGTNYVGLKAPASLSADLTYTLPSADGTNGQALITNGSGVLSFTTISSGTSWQSVQTTGFTAVASKGYPCNTTSSAFTITLPASASVGDYIQIVDYAGTFATNAITINPNGLKINSTTVNKILNTAREAVTLTYVDATQGWLLTSDSQITIPNAPYTINYLIVAGGGGSAGNIGGGGGAGGLLTSTTNLSSGTVYTITVGAGGSAGAGSPGGAGTQGSNSSITGLTAAVGGGYGGTGAGAAGGSGGGAGYSTGSTSPGTNAGGSGTSGQGNAGGSSQFGGPGSYAAAGGGGGASAVGANATTTGSGGGGAGGNGTASSITGSSVTYAGGGGGTGLSSVGSGGTGGGGPAASTSPGASGTAGTANTGGGGGGGGTGGGPGAAGGSGVVILSIPTATYSGIITGSPTVTTSGSNTVVKYTATGTYTG